MCLGKVIAFYEKRGQRHAWVEKPAGLLGNLSYISIKVYIPVSQTIFFMWKHGITIHTTPQDIQFIFWGAFSYSNSNVNSNLILVDNEFFLFTIILVCQIHKICFQEFLINK